MDIQTDYLKQVEQAIAGGGLVLPTMPDTILRIKKVVDDPDAKAADISAALVSDPTLVARILKVVNSPMYRTSKEIEHVHQAISRLGNKVIKSLVVSHAMMQIFVQPSGITKPLFEKIHAHSLEMAAISYAMAKALTKLNPDDALLGGLVYNIGCLPLLQCIELEKNDQLDDEAAMQILKTNKATLGEKILRSWEFPAGIINVVMSGDNRATSDKPDLADIVSVANYYALTQIDSSKADSEKPDVSIFKKLGLDPDADIASMEELETVIKNARAMLSS